MAGADGRTPALATGQRWPPAARHSGDTGPRGTRCAAARGGSNVRTVRRLSPAAAARLADRDTATTDGTRRRLATAGADGRQRVTGDGSEAHGPTLADGCGCASTTSGHAYTTSSRRRPCRCCRLAQGLAMRRQPFDSQNRRKIECPLAVPPAVPPFDSVK